MGRETGLFLDTNVLYGAFECDLFLGIAESGYDNARFFAHFRIPGLT